ncbi:FAD-binding protein [Roseomonas sp. OT10]|uniref:FAD-dependent oxidoreductase n=1 Tax=Roseomonas cutis TaxID=2897332 RepID=UPI001E29A44A|nr:FAD-binding protein [Roseomonas sp. OT10]UFN47702.1 FAD-binding protein [Roseomonas sp. OT10]
MARTDEPGLSLSADVLVIGGGMAGAWTAAAAAREGASVILVDKGYCGTSGVTATAGPGHWWVPPDPPEARETAIRNRAAAGLGLADPAWMERVVALTWEVLPTLARHYDFPADERGVVQYRALRGPEYMRALRALIRELGVTILDHSPALELLAHPDGAVAGARGIRRQRGQEAWQVRAGATVLATGGTSFLSHLLGSQNNTGDGYLMGAEAGVELSGMEFTGIFTVAPARTTMTRSMSYAFATYYDAAGRELPIPPGPDPTRPLARALLAGPVLCSLHRMPEDIRRHLPTVSPNVMLPFARWGIDPFRDRFPVTLRHDGTIRGTGGLRIAGEDCRTRVAGLFAAGDAATRELVAGATSGGGAQNSAWALSSGHWAGRGAARLARRLGRRERTPALPLGQAGLRPTRAARPVELASLREAVRGEMLPYDKALFRTGAALERSRAVLEEGWSELRDHAAARGHDQLRAREAAALLATARWCVAAALARGESRGLHQREDRPEQDPAQAGRRLVGGLQEVWTRPEAHPQATRVMELTS